MTRECISCYNYSSGKCSLHNNMNVAKDWVCISHETPAEHRERGSAA